MKTISILGVVFLPSTFVATFFSMDMFNWDFTDSGKASSSTVSPKIWIYFVTALPLTIITLLVWLLWSRRETQKSSKQLMLYRTTAPYRYETNAPFRKPTLIFSEEAL